MLLTFNQHLAVASQTVLASLSLYWRVDGVPRRYCAKSTVEQEESESSILSSPSPANDFVGHEENVGRDGTQQQTRLLWAATGMCSPPPEEDHRSHPLNHAGGLLHRRTDENEGETKERVST